MGRGESLSLCCERNDHRAAHARARARPRRDGRRGRIARRPAFALAWAGANRATRSFGQSMHDLARDPARPVIAARPAKAHHPRGEGGLDRSDRLWFKDAVIYQLHVKAYFDSNNDGIGDFAGLTQKLDYIKDMGVTALWLLPFYRSPLRDDGY